MSIQDIRNKKITIENENCNNFVTLHKEIKEVTKLLKSREVVKIHYNIVIVYR